MKFAGRADLQAIYVSKDEVISLMSRDKSLNERIHSKSMRFRRSLAKLRKPVEPLEEWNPSYVRSVKAALINDRKFKSFKRDPRYTEVLEDIPGFYGEEYYQILITQSPDLLERIDSIRQIDSIGNPYRHQLPNGQQLSYNTLRYLKVVSDLRGLFGDKIGDEVAEIGVGFGGQMLAADSFTRFKTWTLIDLSPVVQLASRFVENFHLRNSYQAKTLNQIPLDVKFDLVVSNYAFSELPRHLQSIYVEKVLARASKGYLTMNTGIEDRGRTKSGPLTVGDLRYLLPEFRIANDREAPKTYVIYWGTDKEYLGVEDRLSTFRKIAVS